jgi:hypothetical protein
MHSLRCEVRVELRRRGLVKHLRALAEEWDFEFVTWWAQLLELPGVPPLPEGPVLVCPAACDGGVFTRGPVLSDRLVNGCWRCGRRWLVRPEHARRASRWIAGLDWNEKHR